MYLVSTTSPSHTAEPVEREPFLSNDCLIAIVRPARVNSLGFGTLFSLRHGRTAAFLRAVQRGGGGFKESPEPAVAEDALICFTLVCEAGERRCCLRGARRSCHRSDCARGAGEEQSAVLWRFEHLSCLTGVIRLHLP
jgi:hypothetical protein